MVDLKQSSELCRWIIDNLLTEEQLAVVPKGFKTSIRMSERQIGPPTDEALATLQARGDRLASALSIALVVMADNKVCDPNCISCKLATEALTEWRKGC